MSYDSKFRTELWSELNASFKLINSLIQPRGAFHLARLRTKSVLVNVFREFFLYRYLKDNKKAFHYLNNHDALQQTYQWLSDDYSRRLLISLLVRKMLPGSHLLSPIVELSEEYSSAEQLVLRENIKTIALTSSEMMLDEVDLSHIGYNIRAQFHKLNVICTFLLEQYRYKRSGVDIGIQPGDVVIDAGGCWGDTALYMASKRAQNVFSFEFVKDNLDVFSENLASNPQLAERILVVNKALWDESEVRLEFSAGGPGTSLVKNLQPTNNVSTITIDDFVVQKGLTRVDFIKMDIEGAELRALKGAQNTIKRFAPRLAITVYHKPDDLYTVPQIIKGFRPDYDLYLDHFMTNMLETVLFAIPQST